MFEAFLVTTSSEGLSALGTREQRAFELITDTVRDHLTEAHVALFAEPVSTEHGDKIDWYAAFSGRARPLSELSEEEAQILRARLDSLRSDIAALAETLGAADDTNGQRLKEALQNALRVPGDVSIYAVQTDDGLQPVTVNWAWMSDAQRSERGLLSGADMRKPTVVAGTVAAAGVGGAAAATAANDPGDTAKDQSARSPIAGFFPWLLGLGWLLLAGMLTAIVLLLIEPCALRGLDRYGNCPGPAPQADEGRAGILLVQNEIDQIERQIAIADRACQPPPPEPEVIVRQPPSTDIENRLDRAGAMRGDLNVSLAWDGASDVDLAVLCPGGGEISFRRKTACNGQLDVDSNVTTIRAQPVENIFFNAPAAGRYTVRVTLFTKRNTGPQPFEVLIRDASGARVERGVLEREKQVLTYVFDYSGAP